MPQLFHELVHTTARKSPNNPALIHKESQWTYQQLSDEINQFSEALKISGLQPGARVVVYLAKQLELVVSLFGTVQAGGIIVPASPQLKTAQLLHIIEDSDADFLITTSERFAQLLPILKSKEQLSKSKEQQRSVPDIKVILTNPKAEDNDVIAWQSLKSMANCIPAEEAGIDQTTQQIQEDNLAALLYTSGSTGKPKGVMLSHQNLVTGAKSVARYLGYSSNDRILAVLPFSFDYGLSQLTTTFLNGATAVLMDYLLPQDVIKAVIKFNITGLAAVPPLWIQLSNLKWPEQAVKSLRFVTNSGGSLPPATLAELREKIPATQIFLMYGLTEAFRSTYLSPEELNDRPTSMGKAIPHADVFVLRDDGSECSAQEHGELVHAGPLVSLGYWQNPDATERRFKPLPSHLNSNHSNTHAVWSGDTVYRDEQGFLFFVGRTDAMIKSSGYRISPSEVEDVIMEHAAVKEVVALGVAHPQLGQGIVLAIAPKPNQQTNQSQDKDSHAENNSELDLSDLKRFCAVNLPNYMQPQHIAQHKELPKNANGKFDRSLLEKQYAALFTEPQ